MRPCFLFLEERYAKFYFQKLYSIIFRRTFLIGNVMWDKLCVRLYRFSLFRISPRPGSGCISQWDDWWEAEGFLPVWKPEGPHLPSWLPGNQHVGLHLRFGCLLASHSGQVLGSQRWRQLGPSSWLPCNF